MKNILNMNSRGGGGTISLSPINNDSNENGATLTGTVLSLSEANEFYGGVLSASDQIIPGEKTFAQTVNTEKNYNLHHTESSIIGCLTMDDEPFYHKFGYGSNYLGYYSGNLGGYTGGYLANTAVGDFTLRYMNNTTENNSILGAFAGEGLVSSNCTLLGHQAGEFMTDNCDDTICIGRDAGINFNTGNSHNIAISNSGSSDDVNVIRIGNAIHEACYLSGITGSTGTKMVTVEPSTGQLHYRDVLNVSSIGASPNANGMTLTGTTLNLQPASASFGGVVTTGTQTFAGDKTFSGTVAASNLSGTNTGDITLTAIGGSPNANAASLTGQALRLQPASASFPGVVTTGTQSFAGAKTMVNDLTCSANINMSAGATGVGTIMVGSTPMIFLSGASNNSVYVGGAGRYGVNSTTVGIGLNCLANASGGFRVVAIGCDAMQQATSASDTVALGRSSLASCVSGTDNTAVGFNSGANILLSNNILIGSGVTGVASDSGCIRIGGSSQTSCYIGGIGGQTSPSGVAALINTTTGKLGTVVSSAKYKTDVQTLPNDVSAKLNQLRIVKFKYIGDETQRIQYGVIGEEFVNQYPELTVYENDDPQQGVNTVQYLSLIPLLVKELQVQKARIDTQQSTIASLQLQVNSLLNVRIL